MQTPSQNSGYTPAEAQCLLASHDWQQYTACTAQAEQQQQLQDEATVLFGLLLAAAVVAALAYALRRPARRATVYALSLLDRAAYALGIDSRRIAARWRERRP